ncbi:MAG: hypothetical protein JST70_18835 [Bacteroidetes bacterium]|nr:hypothetical protein [Bacteroidota bacterium]
MKKLIILSAFISSAFVASADNHWHGHGHGGGNSGGGTGTGGTTSGASESGSAAQTTNLNLSDAIEITFTGSGNATGNDVNMAFNTVNDYANGVTSGEQEMVVRSNKNFAVSVKANSSQFSYTGTATPTPNMPVSSVLNIKVTANSTGGTVSNPFSTTDYTNITPASRTMISNGSRGGNQTFSIKYMADPGFNYPAGTYSADVVYTATQI